MKKIISFVAFLLLGYTAFSQVGIGNTDPKASLDISATNVATPSNTDGLLIPRIDDFPLANPALDQDGMMVFVTGNGTPTKGFYYWDQDAGPAAWIPVTGVNDDADWYEADTTTSPTSNTAEIFTNGNVGIGISNPDNPLHIGSITPFDLSYQNTGQDGVFINGGGDNSGINALGGSISFGPPSSTRADHRKSAIASVQTGSDIDFTGLGFYVHGNPINQSPMVEAMRLTHQRYLGINNNSPSANLDVIGTLQYEDGNEAAGYVLGSDANGNATWTDPSSIIPDDIDWYEVGTTTAPNAITDNIFTQGKVAIGSTLPFYTLDVDYSGTDLRASDINYTYTGTSTPATGLQVTAQGTGVGSNVSGGYFQVTGSSNSNNATAINVLTSSSALNNNGITISTVGAGGTNRGIYSWTSGATTNWAGYFGDATLPGSGNVRINDELEIVGNFQLVDGTETTDYVLRTDNFGNASWVDPATFGDGVGAERIDDLTDGKSDVDGSQDGSSIFLGINAGAADDSSDNKNVGVGFEALETNSTGENNTAVGYLAMETNSTGSQNTALGLSALRANDDGNGNTGLGYHALFTNTTGGNNTAVGTGALNSNVSGGFNASLGTQALFFNTGGSNTASGYRALYTNTSGTRNTANGLESLNLNSTGSDNVALGYRAGRGSLGSNNIFLGASSGFSETGSNKLYIESSNADADNALIYGEFDNDILRTNGELQIGNPTGTGYALPTNQGAANDVLTSNGDGTTAWTAPTMASVLSNPKFPDGFSGVTPVTHIFSSTNYTVPAGKNLYITVYRSNNTSAILSINGLAIASGREYNVGKNNITNPIIAGPGDIISSSITTVIINGFLVDPIVTPITSGASPSYTVPANKILVLLGVVNRTGAGSALFALNGTTIFSGMGNGNPTLGENAFYGSFILDEADVLTSTNGNFNGYLIDK